MATRKNGISIERIAQETGVKAALVRDILKEIAGLEVERDVQDRVFKTARRLGYDFRKLKIGKRMQHRKELLDEVLEKLAANAGWGRPEIVKFLKESRALVDRVHRRVFREEFGD